ncbi:hypothetical protein P3H15_17590 [Rhodococcus sp. T2V]|uniref:hypothetical protein n=1 Tax=Rhodococcus sp. T2V TaxID=3034164 RepID=UPI0023E09253|nr:hypothetical protein [Rhodococcus sp. T2V]MDF3306838.1 hypothetical protein [Rhodococcus sp. T2V]
MTTASMTPTASITTCPVRRPGVMSTAEIKSRIEAMFADDRSPARPTVTADHRRGIAS